MPDKDPKDNLTATRKEPPPDFSKPPPREKLPEDLQKLLDRQDSWYGQIYEGTAGESTDSNVRYAAYASRIRTILLSAHRYVAYTSDIGESFRPIAHPYMVKGAYAVSWLYLGGDVAYEGYKAYLRNQQVLHPDEHKDVPRTLESEVKPLGPGLHPPHTAPGGTVPALEDYRTVMAQRAVFQSIASMGLPAFTIHSIVRYSGRAMKNVKNTKIRTWGPIGLGLAAVPFLPVMFDKPVEEAVEWTFHKAFETFGGPGAAGPTPPTGRQAHRQKDLQGTVTLDKEL